jgi:hypothetical protein
MRLFTAVVASVSLCACAVPPTRPALGAVIGITGAVIVAGAVVEHRQANHLVPTSGAEEENAASARGARARVDPECDGVATTAE